MKIIQNKLKELLEKREEICYKMVEANEEEYSSLEILLYKLQEEINETERTI